MPVIPVDLAQVNMIWGGNAYPRGAQTAFGVANTLGPLSATAIANAVIAAWDDNLDAVQSQDIALEAVKVKLGPNDTGDEVQIASGQLGNIASNNLPPNVTALVTKNTTAGGRTKGKMFFPGFTEGQTDGAGMFNPGDLATIQTAFDGFLADLLAADIPMFVLRSDPADSPLLVMSLVVQQRMATQKRRLRRAGGHRATP